METLVNANHELLARHTGQPIEKIIKDTERDYFMSPEAAKTYGIIDAVYTPPEKVGATSPGLPAASNPAREITAPADDGPAPAGA
jgi:hypothetical protein